MVRAPETIKTNEDALRFLCRAGNHPCFGGCGKIVSANKAKCLRCLAKEATSNLEAQGIEYEESQVLDLLRDHAL